MNLNNLSVLDNSISRSISPENFTGEKGQGGRATTGTGEDCARDLGPGWKISPFVKIQSGQTFELALIDGPGTIEQIWMTPTGNWRFSILRFYWDDQEYPAVECPVGDFFACGWGKFAPVSSLAVCVNPGSAFNCYWPMPFAKRCRITLENIGDEEMTLYYQINFSLSEISPQAGYFHAQFRRVNPLPYKTDYTILDGVQGKGRYVGTYMAWGVNNSGWWGEGEIKFFLDGDEEFPTFCGTGTEDYFCGSYNFENKETKQYQEESVGFYNKLLEGGVAPEQARAVLPQSMYTTCVTTGTLLGWHHLYKLRTEEHTQLETQEYAKAIGEIMGDIFPNSWSALNGESS